MADTVFRLDPEIIIGPDTVNRAGAVLKTKGSKVMVATEQGMYDHKHIERFIKILEDAGLETLLFDEIPAQAAADTAETAASIARAARCDLVIGLGTMKTNYIAKLISILAASKLGLFDLLDGEKEEKAFLPYAAFPTAAGDPFLFSDYLIAVDPRDRFAKLIKCPRSQCKTVILDPNLSEPLTDKLASTAAFDGLCASLEAYCSLKSSFLSDALLEQAISLYSKMMHSYVENLSADFPALAYDAGLLMSLGVSLAAPGIGTALSYTISARYPVEKAWCATVLLPYVMEKLVSLRPDRMAKAASLMEENIENISTGEAAGLAVEIVRRRMGQLQVPARLKDLNLSLDRLVPVAEAARTLDFVAFSPWTVASEDAYDLLKLSF